MSNSAGDSSSGWAYKAISLSNTVHSEVAPCLPLPSLPMFCGAVDLELRLFDEQRSLNRADVIEQADKIAELLGNTDVSHLILRDGTSSPSSGSGECLELYNEVLRYNPEAFQYSVSGPTKHQVCNTAIPDKRPLETNMLTNQAQRVHEGKHNQIDHDLVNEPSKSSRKPKVRKKASDDRLLATRPDPSEIRDATINDFCGIIEELCQKAEVLSDDQSEAEWLAVPICDLKMIVNEIVSIRSKKALHLVPVDILVRLLRVLDHQIHRAEGLSIDECEHSDSDATSTIFCALESIHAALAIMAHNDMPKQLYKEEIIERILEFSRHQIMDIMTASDPSFRGLHKPTENGILEDEDDEDFDADNASASKRRRISKAAKVKKSAVNKLPVVVNTLIQKMCTVLGFLKELLLIERLSDSCILQLVKTCSTIILVDNIQLLQLKAISLIGGIFYSYAQHRTYVIDEVLQLLWKLPVSRRALRAYHLPDEEQRQIQMITALVIQLVHTSANLPEAMKQPSASSILELSIGASYLINCHEAVTEACVLFWSRILQRLTTAKNQDVSELRTMVENLVADLLTTLNLPEYPASAPILEVLCVLLLQNAGLKSKDIAARSMAIDLLGLIAARLKRDAVVSSKDIFWIIQELKAEDNSINNHPTDACSLCLDSRMENLLFACQNCQRLFHADCMGVREHGVPPRGWYCQFCLCRKQLLVLQSHCKLQHKDNVTVNHSMPEKNVECPNSITKLEIVQQMLLNYLQDADDTHLYVRWFYLCMWYKDDPKSQQECSYYPARVTTNAIVRDSGTSCSQLTRDSVKKITLALGQNSSFSRGFDKILYLLLASLRESSPVVRAKALRAVSIIVEADPEVLCEKHVQVAVEGRFCDSAISAREAALELVGRHIASHPEVGLKYFEKVTERIKDTGVSVRKRAIKIIRDMCTSSGNFLEFTTACIEIISRISDEESSIQDLVCKTFYEFWFEEPSSSQTQFFGDGSSVPLEVAKKTEQIVEMSRKMPNHQLLGVVIKRNLALDFFPQSAKAAGINPLLQASVRKRCELMCKFLLERMLQVDEMSNEEAELQTLPYILALHSFCVVDPTLCAPNSDPSQFVITLQPYLKTQVDNRVVAQLLESIIFIIDSVLPLLRKLPPNVVEELEQDLKQMIVRHSFLTVVHACIKCLCSVSRIAGKGATIVEYLIQLFFKRLESLGVDNKQQIGRSLFCLGLLIRYGNSLLSTSGNKNIDIVTSVTVFKKYLGFEDFIIKVRSLQALGFVLIARPDYMLEAGVRKILEAALSSGSDRRLKIQALQNMHEYLLDAESQMSTDRANNDILYNTGEDRSVPIAAGAGDTNICGGIVQLYWDYILGRCLDVNEHVRHSALKIVEVVMRQGLVHPITCVPYLIALETDPWEVNEKLAHHLLMNMNEKYPAFFESRLGDGLQMSFFFTQSVTSKLPENKNSIGQSKIHLNIKGKSDGGSFSYARLGVSRVYRLIRVNRTSRNKFMSSVVRKFDKPSWSNSVIPFLMYCTDILALLPFTTPDEPLYLIYAINRIIQVRAGAIESNMKSLCLHLSQGDVERNGVLPHEQSPQFDPNHVTSIDLNGPLPHEPGDQPYASTLSSEVDVKIISVRSDGTFDISEDGMRKIQSDCLAATALQLLLKLKRHLKIVYDLNDARCQAYSPSEALKPGESLSKQNIPFNIGDTELHVPNTGQEIVQRYQEFKNALREDAVDYQTYTANIKRKRPAARKSGNKSGPHVTSRNDDSDDDEDDEDWTSSSIRRVGSSRRKGNSNRGARH